MQYIEPLSISKHIKELKEVNHLISKGLYSSALSELNNIIGSDINFARSAVVWLHIAYVYSRMTLWHNAIDAINAVLTFDPNNFEAKRLLGHALFNTGEKVRSCELFDHLCTQKKNSESAWMMRAYVHGQTDNDPQITLAAALDWGRRFADPLGRTSIHTFKNDRSQNKKLKIGYVTADLRLHSVAFFMLPYFENFNPQSIEFHVYNNSLVQDSVTENFKKLSTSWTDIFEIPDESATKKIRNDGIDILVDLSGFTQGARLGIFARKAAPIQITWLGYLNTLGMKAMDYRFVDKNLVPPEHGKFYSEKLYHLDCVSSYRPPDYSPLCETPPMIRNGYPTLISLNNSGKITSEILQLWAQILAMRNDARLIIMVKEFESDAAQRNMLPRLTEAGLPLDRVSVMCQLPLNNFMELGHIADIQLDTAPISGGTTTLHALWMGLPIITMDGKQGIEASSASILRAIDDESIICQSEEEYLSAACRLMNAPQALLHQRQFIRDKMKNCVWMDYESRTEELEHAFRSIWNEWSSKSQVLENI